MNRFWVAAEGRAGLFLYVAWIGAWILYRTVESRVSWMTTAGGQFAYWQVMKLFIWVLPAVVLIRTSELRLRDVIGLSHVRSILLWGGGLLFAASALIDRAVGHRPLFSPSLTWSFVGGVVVAPAVEEITFRGAVLGGLLKRYGFLAANTLTAVFFLGIHLPGWYSQGRLWAMLAHPIGGALSIFIIGWTLGLVAYKSKSVAGSTLTHILNNLFSAL
ncbi:MAG: CPBP family intramembrane metalloprotease [Phycisphaerae bacterium]|nr:CPBP family intramembrane metalloprotease [Phycisphaerae bacterium]